MSANSKAHKKRPSPKSNGLLRSKFIHPKSGSPTLKRDLHRTALRLTQPPPALLRGLLVITHPLHVLDQTFLLAQFLEATKHLVDRLIPAGFNLNHIMPLPAECLPEYPLFIPNPGHSWPLGNLVVY